MIDLYDTDMIRIDEGPVAWMTRKQGTGMNLESFRRGAEEQFAEIGFRANVLTYETDEPGTYAFEVEIVRRLDGKHEFDYDRMIHEVTTNVLDDPDAETGFIKTPTADARAAAAKQKRCH